MLFTLAKLDTYIIHQDNFNNVSSVEPAHCSELSKRAEEYKAAFILRLNDIFGGSSGGNIGFTFTGMQAALKRTNVGYENFAFSQFKG